MEIYRLTAADARVPTKVWVFRVSLGVIVYSALYPLVCSLFPFDHRSFEERAITGAFMALFVVLAQAWTRSRSDYTVTLDGDFLVTKNNGAFRKLDLGNINTIRELKTSLLREGGLFVSERGQIGSFFWGGVWIPKRMPGYEMLKKVIELRRLASLESETLPQG